MALRGGLSKVIGVLGFSLGIISLIAVVVVGDAWFAQASFYVGFALVVVWALWGVFLSIKETIDARKHIRPAILNDKNMKWCKLLAFVGFFMTVLSHFIINANGPSSFVDVIYYAGWVVGATGITICARKMMKA